MLIEKNIFTCTLLVTIWNTRSSQEAMGIGSLSCEMFVCLFVCLWKNVKFFLYILLPASCGIPFQVLPDYQEGAEQVSQHISVFKYVSL